MKVDLFYPKDIVNESSVDISKFYSAISSAKDSNFAAIFPNAKMLGFRIGDTSGSIHFKRVLSEEVCRCVVDSILSNLADELPDYNCQYYETVLR